MSESKRVVVTGLGAVCALGNDVPTIWSRALNKQTGVGLITSFDAEGFSSRVAGEVKGLDIQAIYSDGNYKKARHLDSFVHYAVKTAKEALGHAGLDLANIDKKRMGVSLGVGIGGMHTNTKQSGFFHQKGHRRVSPFFVPALIGNMAAGFLSIELGIKGPNFCLQTACASSNHALAMAKSVLESGSADMMICGGTEAIVEPMTMAGFCNMRALSTSYNDQPQVSSRPFDKGRDGFVMGEGSATILLEEREHAIKRGATIMCELKSVGMSGDAYDMVAPCVDGEGAEAAMRMACQQAGIDAKDIDYVNCHGTSTPVGDLAETMAVHRLVGNSEEVAVSSTKSLTGHMIGAAAAIEALFCIMSIKEQKVIGNVNLFELDERIPLTKNQLSTETRSKKVNVAMSNSFGFGGHNSAAIFVEHRD